MTDDLKILPLTPIAAAQRQTQETAGGTGFGAALDQAMETPRESTSTSTTEPAREPRLRSGASRRAGGRASSEGRQAGAHERTRTQRGHESANPDVPGAAARPGGRPHRVAGDPGDAQDASQASPQAAAESAPAPFGLRDAGKLATRGPRRAAGQAAALDEANGELVAGAHDRGTPHARAPSSAATVGQEAMPVPGGFRAHGSKGEPTQPSSLTGPSPAAVGSDPSLTRMGPAPRDDGDDLGRRVADPGSEAVSPWHRPGGGPGVTLPTVAGASATHPSDVARGSTTPTVPAIPRQVAGIAGEPAAPVMSPPGARVAMAGQIGHEPVHAAHDRGPSAGWRTAPQEAGAPPPTDPARPQATAGIPAWQGDAVGAPAVPDRASGSPSSRATPHQRSQREADPVPGTAAPSSADGARSAAGLPASMPVEATREAPTLRYLAAASLAHDRSSEAPGDLGIRQAVSPSGAEPSRPIEMALAPTGAGSPVPREAASTARAAAGPALPVGTPPAAEGAASVRPSRGSEAASGAATLAPGSEAIALARSTAPATLQQGAGLAESSRPFDLNLQGLAPGAARIDWRGHPAGNGRAGDGAPGLMDANSPAARMLESIQLMRQAGAAQAFDIAPASGFAPLPASVPMDTMTAAPAASTLPVVLSNPWPIDDPAFATHLAAQVGETMSGGLERAEISVTPPEMGPIRIELSLTGDQASVAFSAAMPETRQAIEQSLSTLREMLSERGLVLAEASVGRGDSGASPQRGSAGADAGAGERRDQGAGPWRSTRGEDPGSGGPAGGTPTARGTPRGLLDLFA